MRILFNRENALAALKPGDKTWHQIEVTGEHPARLDGKAITQVIDAVAINMMVDDFDDQIPDIHFPGILVDVDHLSHDPEHSTEGQAWLRKIENRDGQLWGELEWTDLGANAIRNKRLKFFSTEYQVADLVDLGGGRYRPTKLAGLALTNRPNNRGGKPITNNAKPVSDNPEPSTKNPEPKTKNMKSIAQKLGLPEDADEAAILDAIGKLQAESEQHKAKAAEAEAETIVNRFADRLPPGSKEAWKRSLIVNRKEVEALMEASFPAPAKTEGRPAITNREQEKTPGAERATGADPAKSDDAAKAARIKNRAHEIQRDQKITFAAAFKRAQAEVEA